MGEMAVQPERRRFTVDEYFRMAEAGIFGAGERVELLAGEIVAMSPIGDRHMESVARTNEQFVLRFAGRAWVQIQGTLILDDHSAPEPDVAILRRDAYEAEFGKRRIERLYAIVEVSDTSRSRDHVVKAALYAKAGVPEYWVVDLVESVVVVRRDPSPSGYRYERRAGRGEQLAFTAFPADAFAVEALLPR